MTSKNASLMVEITQDIITKLWLGDISDMLKYIDDDFILIDPNHRRFIHGKNELIDILPQIVSDVVKCTITDKEFILAQNCGRACTVLGCYSLSIDGDDAGPQMTQHCIFTWELSPENMPVIKHIGVTKLESAVDNKEPVVTEHKIPTEAKPSAMSQRLVISDLDECTPFISHNDILYATSDGRNTVIRCFNEDINARISISAFLKLAGSRFLAIHRCYAVNVDHITHLKPYAVVLCDGSEIPVPVKRYGEIKQKLTALLGARE